MISTKFNGKCHFCNNSLCEFADLKNVIIQKCTSCSELSIWQIYFSYEDYSLLEIHLSIADRIISVNFKLNSLQKYISLKTNAEAVSNYIPEFNSLDELMVIVNTLELFS
jgi:hypothetical protein